MSEQQAQNIPEAFQGIYKRACRKKFVFLLIGRTGVGKSSTVNALMGKEISPVGGFEATTMEVEFYESELNGIPFTVIDTPGLCDDNEEAGKDQQYLALIRSKVKQIDSMWFISPLNDTRVRSDEIQTIRLISKTFGTQVWKHAVIIFTFANTIKTEAKYLEALKKRTELIRNEIAKCEDVGLVVANNIPSVAVDTESQTTPDGEKWLGELFTKVFSRISERGAVPFFVAMADSLKPVQRTRKEYPQEYEQPSYSTNSEYLKPRIELSELQEKEVKKTIDAKIIPVLTAAGIAVGTPFGPIGAAIGGAIGAVLGSLAWFCD